MPSQLLITFGHWHNSLSYLDYYYHNIVTRLIQFIREAGVDRYGRYYNLEPLVDFAINNKITDTSADYIYRHYTYHLLSKHQQIDVNKEELRYLFNEFTLVPEWKKVYYDVQNVEEKIDYSVVKNPNNNNDNNNGSR